MNKRDLEPPEDSIPLRIVVFLMTLTCMGASFIFIRTSWAVITLCLALLLIGTIVAYQHRNEKQGWMQWVVLVGMLAVGANALQEFTNPMNGPADFWGPVVHFIAGTFALHTFDLKSRSDMNLSAMLGAMILCGLSPIVRSLYFGIAVFLYLCLGTIMLYFDSVSRTEHNWLTKPMEKAPVAPTYVAIKKRSPTGNISFTMALLPIAALMVFLAVPRSDSTMDRIISVARNFNVASVMRLLPQVMPKAINLPKRNPYDPSQIKTISLAPKNLKAESVDKKNDVPTAKKAPKPEVKDKNLDKKGEAKKPEQKEPPKKEEEKDKDKEKNDEGKDKETPKSKDESKSKSKEGDKSAEKSGKDGKKGGKEGDKEGSKGGKGGKGGKEGGKGTPGGEGEGGAPGAERRSSGSADDDSEVLFPKDMRLDAYYSEKARQTFVLRVSSTRLFYPRMNVFDTFDGAKWTRSKDNKPFKFVEIKSGAGSGPDSKPVVKLDTDKKGKAGKPGELNKELTPEEEAELQVAQEQFFAEEKNETGFGPNEVVHYLFSKSEKSQYDVKQAAAFHPPALLSAIDLTQNYEAMIDLGSELPAGWLPASVGYNGSVLTVDDYGRMVFAEPLKKGSIYKVGSSWPVNDLAGMREAPALTAEEENSYREKLANYLQLPENLSPEVAEMAGQLVGDTGNWFTQAENLCVKLRTHATYTLQPLKEIGEDPVYQFLFETKKGNSRDFATAFTIMCRTLGLPARVVTGFGPGTFNKLNGTHEIYGKDAHAWSEVFIPQYGWVAFDATPTGVFPSQRREEGFNYSSLAKLIEKQLGIEDEEGLTPKKIFAYATLGFSFLVFCGGVIYGLFVLLRYLKRQKDLGRNRGPEWAVYSALLKSLKKMGIERLNTETRVEFVERVRGIIDERARAGMSGNGELPPALDQFLSIYEEVHFGNKKDKLKELKTCGNQLRGLIKPVKVKKAKGDKTKGETRHKKPAGKNSDQAVSSAVRGKK